MKDFCKCPPALFTLFLILTFILQIVLGSFGRVQSKEVFIPPPPKKNALQSSVCTLHSSKYAELEDLFHNNFDTLWNYDTSRILSILFPEISKTTTYMNDIGVANNIRNTLMCLTQPCQRLHSLDKKKLKLLQQKFLIILVRSIVIYVFKGHTLWLSSTLVFFSLWLKKFRMELGFFHV